MRILLYGINYAPELAGIGKYTAEMAAWLAAAGHDVSVFTAHPYYPEWEVHPSHRGKYWSKEIIDGVRVYRSPLYVPSKVSAKKRILHEFSFLWTSSLYWLGALFQEKYDLVISITPPFHLGIAPFIYTTLRKTTLVTHIQDLQIDAAKDLQMLSNKKALKLMFGVEKFLLKHSSFVSTLTDGMKAKIIAKGIPSSKIRMLPNWVDIDIIRPLAKEQSLRYEWGIPIADKVILYSGNMGEKQGLDTLIDVAELLKDQLNLHFVLVGSGVGKQKLEELVAEKQLANVTFYPLQPYDKLSALLATADIHLVLQRKSASDLVMPSKLTGIFAAGGCAIVTATEDTSLYKLVKDKDIAILCEPESPTHLAATIMQALARDLSVLRQKARQYAEEELDKDIIIQKFLEGVTQL